MIKNYTIKLPFSYIIWNGDNQSEIEEFLTTNKINIEVLGSNANGLNIALTGNDAGTLRKGSYIAFKQWDSDQNYALVESDLSYSSIMLSSTFGLLRTFGARVGIDSTNTSILTDVNGVKWTGDNLEEIKKFITRFCSSWNPKYYFNEENDLLIPITRDGTGFALPLNKGILFDTNYGFSFPPLRALGKLFSDDDSQFIDSERELTDFESVRFMNSEEIHEDLKRLRAAKESESVTKGMPFTINFY